MVNLLISHCEIDNIMFEKYLLIIIIVGVNILLISLFLRYFFSILLTATKLNSNLYDLYNFIKRNLVFFVYASEF